MSEKKLEIRYSIIRIKESEFLIKNEENIDLSKINFHFEYDFEIRLAEETFSVNITGIFHPINEAKNELVRLKVTTVFKINDLERFTPGVDSEGLVHRYNLPKEFVESVFGISFSHLRAIFAMRTSGTIYDKLIIPLVNPSQILENNQIRQQNE